MELESQNGILLLVSLALSSRPALRCIDADPHLSPCPRRSGVGSFFAVGAWFVLPETSKRTSAELDELFARKIKPWRFHKTKTAIQLAAEEEKEQQREIGEI
jgi:hypothetical protein